MNLQNEYCIHHVCLSACLPVGYLLSIWNNSAPAGWISMNVHTMGLLLKSVEKVWVWLTLDQYNRHFTWSTAYIYGSFVSNSMAALIIKVTCVAVDVTGQLVLWLLLLLMLTLTIWLPWLLWLQKLPLYLCYHVHWSYQCLFFAVVKWMHLKCFALQTCPVMLDMRKNWRKILASVNRPVLS